MGTPGVRVMRTGMVGVLSFMAVRLAVGSGLLTSSVGLSIRRTLIRSLRGLWAFRVRVVSGTMKVRVIGGLIFLGTQDKVGVSVSLI